MKTLILALLVALSGCHGDKAYDQDGDGFPDCRLYEEGHWPNYTDKYGCFEEGPEWFLVDTGDPDGLHFSSYGYGWYNPAVHDCNDTDPTIHPGVAEEEDGADNDCDGLADNGTGPDDLEADFDGDGFVHFASEQYNDPLDDCDPLDAAISPGVEEICDDGIDNNCDGEVDEGVACGDTGAINIGPAGDPGCQCSGRAGRPVPIWLIISIAWYARARGKKGTARSRT